MSSIVEALMLFTVFGWQEILKQLADRVLQSSGSRNLAQFTTCSRLDLPTSGVLVIAHGRAGSPAANWLQAQFSSRLVRKRYLCLCVGQSLGEVGTKGEITTPLLLKRGESVSGLAVPSDSDQGLEAQTLYEVLARYPIPRSIRSLAQDGNEPCEIVYLAVRPRTGRVHQIRAHFASIGRPLLGDRKYSEAPGALGSPLSPKEAETVFGLRRLFLHCQKMEMQDLDGESFSAEMPLAEDLQQVLRRLSQAEKELRDKARAMSSCTKSVSSVFHWSMANHDILYFSRHSEDRYFGLSLMDLGWISVCFSRIGA